MEERMQTRYEKGQLCPKAKENGEECGALMEEKSVFWLCPKCGHVLHMTKSERQAKMAKIERRASEPNYVGFRGIDGQSTNARFPD
jgi:hypothetical protein